MSVRSWEDGGRKRAPFSFLRDMNFCWDPGILKVLGIKFSTNTVQINVINYETKLVEIKNILTGWKKRQHTLLGKITVIKS